MAENNIQAPTDRMRSLEDQVLRLETQLEGLKDKHDDLRDEVRTEILVLRKEIADLKDSIRLGFDGLREDIRSTRSLKTWVIGGMATGGSAIGAAIWHAIQIGIRQ